MISKDEKICIIGGGPAGVSAGWYLHKKGYKNVTVFEKEERLGGKCETVIDNGRAYELGAILITPDYKQTLALMDEFNVETVKAPDIYAMDPSNGNAKPYPALDTMGDDEKGREFYQDIALRYIQELRHYRHHVGKPGFHNIPEELTLTFEEWAKLKNLTTLLPLFLVPVTTFGYGFLNEIPAAYVLKCMSKRSFTALGATIEDWPRIVKDGYQFFVEKIGKALPDLRTLSEIISVKRSSDSVIVEWLNKSENKKQTETFDKIIIARPLDSQGLNFIDLTPEENTLFSKVKYVNYYTSLCEIDGFSPKYGYASVLYNGEIKEPTLEEPCLWAFPWEGSNLGIAYICSTRSLSEEELRQNIAKHINRMGKKVIEIKEVRSWEYFPHISSDDMKLGWFDKLENMQGHNRTYYTGGQLDFDIVEGAISFSHRLVSTYF